MATSSSIPARPAEEIDRLIRNSILEKVALRATYDGRVRVLCPQLLGRNRDGLVRVLCLQIGGESASGLHLGDGLGAWRCLALEKFSHVERSDDRWPTAVNPLRPPKCIDRIELEVAGHPEREPKPEREPQNGQ